MSELSWFGDYGFLEANPDGVYNQAYFDKYVGYSQTEIGKRLTAARRRLVLYYAAGYELVDVGIGSGQFVEAMNCKGYDINPVGIKWLEERGRFHDIYKTPVECMTFWDSLEHIRNPTPIINNCKRFMFVSMPVFRDKDHVLSSKHYRPDEHYWYFTAPGFERWMANHGFRLIDASLMEVYIGREDIQTFVFRRLT